MFVKLAFSVAAHLNSEILIMDEVLAVGDMAFQSKCIDRMRKAAAEEGRTVLYVSHNMSTIRSLCDRCIVLDQGRVIFDGSPEEAISVYLNRGVEKNEVDIDLTAKTHLNRGLDTGLTMCRLRLEDRVTPAYDTSEVMRLRFRVSITKPLKNVRFRMILRNSIDQSVGTAWSEPVDFDETGEKVVSYRFPLNRLCRGTLYASIGFFRINEGGGIYRYDLIENAFRVELSTRTGFRNWNTNQCGYVRLPDMSVERG
jgi:lipopolysaccharide transport system ATP-binding protein